MVAHLLNRHAFGSTLLLQWGTSTTEIFWGGGPPTYAHTERHINHILHATKLGKGQLITKSNTLADPRGGGGRRAMGQTNM